MIEQMIEQIIGVYIAFALLRGVILFFRYDYIPLNEKGDVIDFNEHSYPSNKQKEYIKIAREFGEKHPYLNVWYCKYLGSIRIRFSDSFWDVCCDTNGNHTTEEIIYSLNDSLKNINFILKELGYQLFDVENISKRLNFDNNCYYKDFPFIIYKDGISIYSLEDDYFLIEKEDGTIKCDQFSGLKEELKKLKLVR